MYPSRFPRRALGDFLIVFLRGRDLPDVALLFSDSLNKEVPLAIRLASEASKSRQVFGADRGAKPWRLGGVRGSGVWMLGAFRCFWT